MPQEVHAAHLAWPGPVEVRTVCHAAPRNKAALGAKNEEQLSD